MEQALTNPDPEAVERVLVDILQLLAQAQCVVSHGSDVAEAAQVPRGGRQPCGHVGAAL